MALDVVLDCLGAPALTVTKVEVDCGHGDQPPLLAWAALSEEVLATEAPKLNPFPNKSRLP